VLVGELQAGNDNPQIRAKLKEYVILGLKTGRIKKADGLELLMQLTEK